MCHCARPGHGLNPGVTSRCVGARPVQTHTGKPHGRANGSGVILGGGPCTQTTRVAQRGWRRGHQARQPSRQAGITHVCACSGRVRSPWVCREGEGKLREQSGSNVNIPRRVNGASNIAQQASSCASSAVTRSVTSRSTTRAHTAAHFLQPPALPAVACPSSLHGACASAYTQRSQVHRG